ncbi:WecB/TagA/CpsF family glycosyltransferase [Acetobacter estunensis NRIC 0472]|uniref:WecB/TagA/CpsF family glycosyltransferase n=1 Tax=Acetobacter estunensis TaxID=104097 RepID=A0A967EHA6_9PROT|nr:WecB/TagA/CpsF family glycosyltransferase [Acetobacter estunensis]NHO53347.1 WecB/TagA/CpsF family glycosyltransferase [Acetobacter estunensis]GBQ22132.1 WecB/TagA/CpsF family glycosyltransferase [Acetobacter estunensis NRIC 0472]
MHSDDKAQTFAREVDGYSFPVVNVMGLPLLDIPREEIVRILVDLVRAGKGARVINANAHCVTLSQRLPWLRMLFRQAEIAFCDGAGVQLASRFLTGRSLHRTTPPEWVGNVLEALGKEASVFWLGGADGVVQEAAEAFSVKYGCRTAGCQHGFFDATAGSPESEAVIEAIVKARPSVLLLNMGMPRQERWLWDNWNRLPPVVAITAGALVDHAAGRVSRPPMWVANAGLEWLVRLSREPQRLWKRYLLGLPLFGLYVLRWKLGMLLGRKAR